jgi:hypothetical protein
MPPSLARFLAFVALTAFFFLAACGDAGAPAAAPVASAVPAPVG